VNGELTQKYSNAYNVKISKMSILILPSPFKISPLF